MKTLRSIAAAACLVCAANSHAGITIDNFNVSQTGVANAPGSFVLDGTANGTGFWSQVAGPVADIFGGFRDIYAIKTAGGAGATLNTTAEVIGGAYSFSSASGTSGTGIIRWDGATPGVGDAIGDGSYGIVKNGVASTNVAAAAFGFKVTVLSADLDFPFTLQAFSGLTDWTEVTIKSTGPGLFFIPFAAFFGADIVYTNVGGFGRTTHFGGANFGGITALQAIINPGGSTEAVDLTIDLADTSEVPEPGSIALVGLALLGLSGARRFVKK